MYVNMPGTAVNGTGSFGGGAGANGMGVHFGAGVNGLGVHSGIPSMGVGTGGFKGLSVKKKTVKKTVKSMKTMYVTLGVGTGGNTINCHTNFTQL